MVALRGGRGDCGASLLKTLCLASHALISATCRL